MPRLHVCFIDDDDRFEIPLFTEVFGGRFDLIVGTSLTACSEVIAAKPGWLPDIFVLDLHYPFAEVDQKRVSLLAGQLLEIPPDGGSLRQAYLNVRAAEGRLQGLLQASGQGPEGGLRLAAQVRTGFHGVPIVFYSRKATAEDYLRGVAQPGVVGMLFKPSGRNDEETTALTSDRAPAIAAAIVGLMAANTGALSALKAACSLVSRSLAEARHCSAQS